MSEENQKSASSSAVGVIKAYGLYSKEAQHYVRRLAERGEPGIAAMAVARCLLDAAYTTREVPEAGGMRTRDLVIAVKAAIHDVAHRYGDRGVLVAKGFIRVFDLENMIFMLWTQDFRPPVPVTVDLAAEKTAEEVNERLALAAQEMLDVITARFGYNGTGDFVIGSAKLEGFCKTSARAMFDAFQRPNEFVHERLHGKKP